MDSSQSNIQKNNSQPQQQINEVPSNISTSSSSSKLKTDISYTKRQKIIRAVLDSYLRGCIIGNLIDQYRLIEQELAEATYKKILTGEIWNIPFAEGREANYDITWHYLLFAEIYTLLEYDSFLSPEPLNFESYIKYLLVMMNTCNNQTRKQLQNIFPPTIQIPQDDTPSGNQSKYMEALQQWASQKQRLQSTEFQDRLMRNISDINIHLKLTISKIVPILFIYSTNSLKIPVEKVSNYIKKFSQSNEQQSLALYFVFMNKLLKYYLKENSIQKALAKIKLKLKDKKKYLGGQHISIFKKFEKKIEKLKIIQKEQRFAQISESSPSQLIDEYSIQVQGLKKTKDYVKFEQFLVDIIVLLIGYIGILEHDSIVIKMSKLQYQKSSIPALLLSFPVLAVKYPERYSENENNITYKINSSDCLLNYLKPDPWFSSQISNKIFTEFVNLFSERFYRNSK